MSTLAFLLVRQSVKVVQFQSPHLESFAGSSANTPRRQLIGGVSAPRCTAERLSGAGRAPGGDATRLRVLVSDNNRRRRAWVVHAAWRESADERS